MVVRILQMTDVAALVVAASRQQAARLAPLIDALMAPGGVVVSDQPMTAARWQALPLPAGVAPGRYHMWHVGG